MKKNSFILLSSVILSSFAACQRSSNSLTKEEFVDKANQMNEEHTYNKAHMNVSIIHRGEKQNTKQSGTVEFIYDYGSFVIKDDYIPAGYSSLGYQTRILGCSTVEMKVFI